MAEQRDVSNAYGLKLSCHTSNSLQLRKSSCPLCSNSRTRFVRISTSGPHPVGSSFLRRYNCPAPSMRLGRFCYSSTAEEFSVVRAGERRRSRGIADHQLWVHLVLRNIPIALF